MTSPYAQGQKNPYWGPPRRPGPPPHYLPPPVPQSSGALAIIAFIGSLVAFFFGWVPFIGLGLGLIFLLLSVLAVLKPTLRGMAITGIVLSTLATLTSLVTTGIVVLGIIGANSPPSSAGASPAPSYTAEDFQETDERTLSTIARDPGAHAGETLIVYGHISQFDANTGPCTMRMRFQPRRDRAGCTTTTILWPTAEMDARPAPTWMTWSKGIRSRSPSSCKERRATARWVGGRTFLISRSTRSKFSNRREQTRRLSRSQLPLLLGADRDRGHASGRRRGRRRPWPAASRQRRATMDR